MRSSAENRLVALAAVVSLGLTGLTVWAVRRQGQALRQREWADLVSVARTAAAQREALVRAEAQRAADVAAGIWKTGGADELDVWAADQRSWLLISIVTADGAWQNYPRTPLEEPLNSPLEAGVNRGVAAREAGEQPTTDRSRDLSTALESFKRLTGSPDPLTRAGALLALATFEQRLGHPLAAAQTMADAAALLRSTPGLTRIAFRAELGRIEALLSAGHHERARDALELLCRGLLTEHPGRLGCVEMERLEQQASAIGLAAEDPLAVTLAELRRRATRRDALAAAAARLWPPQRPTSQPGDELTFLTGDVARDERAVVAIGDSEDGIHVALVSPASDLFDRFWRTPGTELSWRLARPPVADSDDILVRLGPMLADAALVLSPTSRARLQAMDQRRLAVLAVTAAGTAGAWVLVIWMMTRAVTRQRELARLQSRFVADISHELKTPLALIRLLSETLAEGRMRDPHRVLEYHQTITREADRLGTLLDNILDMGRIESGRKRYEFGECDLVEVARQSWALFEPQFAQSGFDARLELAPNLPRVRADAAALQQVLVNLLQNAYRYAGEGKYVRCAVVREGNLVVLTVEDHGLGMSRAQLQRLGESFFRAEDTRVRQTRGTGLGLAIVNHIVTAHRGKVEVDSRPGQGSCFTIWIPIEQE